MEAITTTKNIGTTITTTTTTTTTTTVSQSKLVLLHCPRIYPWHNRTLDSMLHPHIAEQALRIRRRRYSTFEMFDCVEASCPACKKSTSRESVSFVADPSLRQQPGVHSLSIQLQFMPAEDKWHQLESLYGNVASHRAYTKHLATLREEVEKHPLVNDSIAVWWRVLSNRRGQVEKRKLASILSRICDVLIPSCVLNPVERMQSIQVDCQKGLQHGTQFLKSCGTTIPYSHFRQLFLELCDNFVNMDVCRQCGGIDHGFNAFELGVWGKDDKSYMNRTKADRVTEGIEQVANSFCLFLNKLHSRVLSGGGSLPPSPSHRSCSLPAMGPTHQDYRHHHRHSLPILISRPHSGVSSPKASGGSSNVVGSGGHSLSHVDLPKLSLDNHDSRHLE